MDNIFLLIEAYSRGKHTNEMEMTGKKFDYEQLNQNYQN